MIGDFTPVVTVQLGFQNDRQINASCESVARLSKWPQVSRWLLKQWQRTNLSPTFIKQGSGLIRQVTQGGQVLMLLGKQGRDNIMYNQNAGTLGDRELSYWEGRLLGFDREGFFPHSRHFDCGRHLGVSMDFGRGDLQERAIQQDWAVLGRARSLDGQDDLLWRGPVTVHHLMAVGHGLQTKRKYTFVRFQYGNIDGRSRKINRAFLSMDGLLQAIP